MEESNEQISWTSIIQHFYSRHVEISLFENIRRILYEHRCIAIEGCRGSGKTHCSVIVMHHFANAENIAFITHPSQWERNRDKTHIIFDNVDASDPKWIKVVQDACRDGHIKDVCDEQIKRFVIITLNSTSSHGIKNVDLYSYQMHWNSMDKNKLGKRYSVSQYPHDERMGFPLFCSMVERWKVEYKNEFDPDHYFDEVLQKVAKTNYEEFCRICSVAMVVGEGETLGLESQDKKHVMKNIHCLRNMRKIPGHSLHSESIFQSEDEIMKHLKWMSLSLENHLRLPALKWLLSHDPGLLLDNISLSALVTFAKLRQGIETERRLLIDEQYHLAIIQRIACGLSGIDTDILEKSPLMKDTNFSSKLFMQLYVLSSSIYPCEKSTENFERESKTFHFLSKLNGFERFFKSFLTWKNKKEMLELKSALQFYLDRSISEEFPKIFSFRLKEYEDWSDIEAKLFPVENWDFADTILLCYASEDFPRYDYHVSLIRKLLERVAEIEKSSKQVEIDTSEDDTYWSFPLIMARGIISKDNIDLLSNKGFYREEVIEKSTFEKSLEDHLPLCIVCFMTSTESFTTSENVEKLRRTLPDLAKQHDGISLVVLLVTDPSCKKLSEELSVQNVEIVQVSNRKEDVREAVTSLLEERLLCFIEKIAKNHDNLINNKSLLVQKKAICKRLNRRKYTSGKRKAELKPSRVIPKMMKLVLDKYRQSIVSYGFWMDKFQIHVHEKTSKELIDKIWQELQKFRNSGEFNWKTELISTTGEWDVKPHSFVKQGDKCFSFRGQGDDVGATAMHREQQGTVGGFAKMKKRGEKEKLAVFSCDHVYRPKEKMYVKFRESTPVRPVGECTRNFNPRDLSLVIIYPKVYDNFDQVFRNPSDEKVSARIYECELDALVDEIVHKKGARTGWTCGIVKCVQHFNDHREKSTIPVLFIEGIDSCFSKRGDSAAYVIRNGYDTELKTIDIIGVLRGKWNPPPQQRNLLLYTSENDEKKVLNEREENLIVCEDLKSVIDILSQEGYSITFRENIEPQ